MNLSSIGASRHWLCVINMQVKKALQDNMYVAIEGNRGQPCFYFRLEKDLSQWNLNQSFLLCNVLVNVLSIIHLSWSPKSTCPLGRNRSMARYTLILYKFFFSIMWHVMVLRDTTQDEIPDWSVVGRSLKIPNKHQLSFMVP